MGSVMSDITCPECGYGCATIDTYYKTGEEYVNCNRCGSGSSVTIVNRPEDGNYPEDWKPEYEEKSHKTAHAFAVSKDPTGGIRSCGGLKRNQLKDFVRDVKNSDEVKYATYTYKYRELWFIKDVINDTKKPFADTKYGDEEQRCS